MFLLFLYIPFTAIENNIYKKYYKEYPEILLLFYTRRLH